jgi:hypothetical protein
MTTVRHAIKENDVVELREQEGKWPAGTIGAIVSDYGEVKLVEISDADNFGATLDLIQVAEPRLKLIAKHSL